MKALCLILCICLLVGLAGCSPAQEAPVPSTAEAATQDTSAPAQAATETNAPTEETQAPVNLVDTRYYTLTLPVEWADSCITEIFELDDGLYVLSLYETTAYKEFGGGNLCSIQLLPTGDDTYKEFPSYELLGTLDTADGYFNVIILYPTDVQFSENAVEAYIEMFDRIQDVLFTLSPKEGSELLISAPAA